MSPVLQTVAEIDVGGARKGFHAVALRDGVFETLTSIDPDEIVHWCLERHATIVAVDAPCGWSQAGASRLAERQLEHVVQGSGSHASALRAFARAEKGRSGSTAP